MRANSVIDQCGLKIAITFHDFHQRLRRCCDAQAKITLANPLQDLLSVTGKIKLYRQAFSI